MRPRCDGVDGLGHVWRPRRAEADREVALGVDGGRWRSALRWAYYNPREILKNNMSEVRAPALGKRSAEGAFQIPVFSSRPPSAALADGGTSGTDAASSSDGDDESSEWLARRNDRRLEFERARRERVSDNGASALCAGADRCVGGNLATDENSVACSVFRRRRLRGGQYR